MLQSKQSKHLARDVVRAQKSTKYFITSFVFFLKDIVNKNAEARNHCTRLFTLRGCVNRIYNMTLRLTFTLSI